MDEALTLPDTAYQFAVRLRLGLPLAEVGDLCKVYNNTTHRTCGCQLTAHADHALGCARAARNKSAHRAMGYRVLSTLPTWRGVRTYVRAMARDCQSFTSMWWWRTHSRLASPPVAWANCLDSDQMQTLRWELLNGGSMAITLRRVTWSQAFGWRRCLLYPWLSTRMGGGVRLRSIP